MSRATEALARKRAEWLATRSGTELETRQRQVSTRAIAPLRPFCSATDLDDLRLPITLLKGVYATNFSEETPVAPVRVESSLTPSELAYALAPESPIIISAGIRGTKGNALDRAKKAHALYALPALLLPGTVRDAATVPTGHWLPIDLDGIPEADWQRIQHLLAQSGAWFLAYSTFSDGLKDVHLGRRIRLVLLLDRPANKREFAKSYRRVAHLLGVRDDVPLRADEAAGKPEQLAGARCIPSNEVVKAAGLAPSPWEPLRVLHEGAALSVDLLVAATQGATEGDSSSVTKLASLPPGSRAAALASNDDLIQGVPGQEPLPVTKERVEDALRWLDADCARAPWVELGMLLKAVSAVLSDQEMRAAWLAWSDSAAPASKADNDGSNSPATLWETFAPKVSADVALSTICARAKDAALIAAHAARGSKTWTDNALEAVRYLQSYHPGALAEFGPEHPPLPEPAAAAQTEASHALGLPAMDQSGNSILVNGGDVLPIESQAAQDLFIRHLQAKGKAVTQAAVSNMALTLGPLCRASGRTVHVFRRFGTTDNGHPCIDLGDAARRAIVLDPSSGTWSLVEGHGVLFHRPQGYGQHPAPDFVPGGVVGAWNYVLGFLDALGVPPDSSPLVAVLLACWMVERGGAYPVLELLGSAGSGKTTAAHTLGMVVDPRASGLLLTPTAWSMEKLAPIAQSTPIFLGDNLSYLPRDGQDLLCQIATGVEGVVRTLYTTTGTTTMFVHARVVITGISPVITRVDLLDRTIRVNLTGPRRRLDDWQRKAWLEQERPKLLASMCTLLAAGLKHLPVVPAATHRLAEFQRLGWAIYTAMGRDLGEFEALTQRHRGDIAAYNADADPFTNALTAILAEQCKAAAETEKLPPWYGWAEKGKPGICAAKLPKGHLVVASTSKALLDLTRNKMLTGTLGRFDNEHAIPKHVRALDSAVTRVTPTLRDLGWNTERRNFSENRRAWVFVRTAPPGDG